MLGKKRRKSHVSGIIVCILTDLMIVDQTVDHIQPGLLVSPFHSDHSETCIKQYTLGLIQGGHSKRVLINCAIIVDSYTLIHF